MENKQLSGWVASSANSAEVSTRIKGIVLALSSIIIFFAANLFGINLTATDVVDLAGLLGTASGVIFSLYGAGLALIRWFATIQ